MVWIMKNLHTHTHTHTHTQPVMYFEDKCDREVFSQNLQTFPSFLPTEN